MNTSKAKDITTYNMNNSSGNMISLWRIIFTYYILIYHILCFQNKVKSGYIGVDFFFIVAGYLMMKGLEKKELHPVIYIYNRIVRLYPEYFVAVIVCFVLASKYDFSPVIGNLNINKYFEWFVSNGWQELLMLQNWTWSNPCAPLANPPLWYVSELLLVSIIIYSFLYYKRDIGLFLYIPVFSILAYTYLYRTCGSLGVDKVYGNLINARLLRGMADMGIGALLLELKKFKKGKNKWVPFGNICLPVVIMLACFFSGGIDFFYIILLAMGVYCAFDTPLPKKISKPIIRLEGICYSIYLNNTLIHIYYVREVGYLNDIRLILISVIVLTIYSALTHILVVRLCGIKFSGRKVA